MTDFNAADRDVSRAIRSWLREDRHEDASRIAGTVLDHVEATPRRRATWWPVRRTPIMNRFVTIGLGVAAVVVVGLLLGNQLLGSPTGAGVEPSPTPTATPEPTAEPTPDPTPEGPLPAGATYPLSASNAPVAISVTIPAPGWHGDDCCVAMKSDADAPDGAGLITFVTDDGYYVYDDPCEWSTTRPQAPSTTVDEFVAALSAQALRNASEPVDITVDGYAGKSITLHVPQGAEFDECDQGFFASWGNAGLTEHDLERYHQDPGQIDKLWILDVDGHLVIFDTAYYAGTPRDVVDELDAIVGSATFGE